MTQLGTLHQGDQVNNKLCWEDFSAGQKFHFGHNVIGRDDIVRFARLYDPQPFHTDEHAAKLTMLEGLAASGWHVCTIFMRMLDEGLLSRCKHAGIDTIDEVQWRVPVRPNDQLRCRITCLDLQPSLANTGHGLGIFYCEAINSHQDTVMTWRLQLKLVSRNGIGDQCSAVSKKNARASSVVRRSKEHAINFFEDVQVGDDIELGSYTLSRERILAFNTNYGHQPVHPDARLGHVSASGWHLTAIWMQRLVRYYNREARWLESTGRAVPQLGPSPGVKDLRWHRPVYEGDTLSFSCWAERKVGMSSKSGWGLLYVGSDVYNQDSELILSFHAFLFLERHRKQMASLNPNACQDIEG